MKYIVILLFIVSCTTDAGVTHTNREFNKGLLKELVRRVNERSKGIYYEEPFVAPNGYKISSNNKVKSIELPDIFKKVKPSFFDDDNGYFFFLAVDSLGKAKKVKDSNAILFIEFYDYQNTGDGELAVAFADGRIKMFKPSRKVNQEYLIEILKKNDISICEK